MTDVFKASLPSAQVLVPPGYGEDVKTWPVASIVPPDPIKESPRVLKADEN